MLFSELEDNDRMLDISISAYTKDIRHDISTLGTHAREKALVTNLLLAPEVGLIDYY